MPDRLPIGDLSLDGSAPPFEVLAHQAVPLGRGEARRTTEVILPLVADAVAKYARGEVVGFEVIVQVMPGPPLEGSREPQWNPMAVITVDIAPAAGVGTENRILNVSNALPPTAAGWNPEAVDTIVGTLLDGCFALRSEQLDAVAAQARGDEVSPSGLFLPQR